MYLSGSKKYMSEFILYNTEDGRSEIKIILDNESRTIWLNQKQMSDLFNVSLKTINEHIINIYKEEELQLSGISG